MGREWRTRESEGWGSGVSNGSMTEGGGEYVMFTLFFLSQHQFQWARVGITKRVGTPSGEYCDIQNTFLIFYERYYSYTAALNHE
ncbi:hypothetical protein LSAT2_027667 [Lamellibrachia satsuma]|nr:hypothetical protein LSAT2_027667 [Lamellibrachia satsuma]